MRSSTGANCWIFFIIIIINNISSKFKFLASIFVNWNSNMSLNNFQNVGQIFQLVLNITLIYHSRSGKNEKVLRISKFRQLQRKSSLISENA